MADKPSDQPKPKKPLAGSLLLADPSLRDGTFDKSVIFLTHHTAADGAHGLILNHPTGKEVGDLLCSPEFSPLKHIPVHIGGPVANDQLTFACFTWSKNKGLQCEPSISAADAIKRSNQSGTLLRAFVGYTGWSAGQLESELKRHSWITTKPAQTLLSSPQEKSLWADTLRRMSPLHEILAESPDDPFLN